MPAGTQGNPVNSLQLQINSGEGVIAHGQIYFIIINTKEESHRKKRREPKINLWQWQVLFVCVVVKTLFPNDNSWEKIKRKKERFLQIFKF